MTKHIPAEVILNPNWWCRNYGISLHEWFYFNEPVVLPSWGTAKLLQAQGIGQASLDQTVRCDHRGRAVKASAQGRVQKYELLNVLTWISHHGLEGRGFSPAV
jgi:hypothetical protein